MGNSILCIPPAMTRRVDRERGLFWGQSLRGQNWSRGEGRGGNGGVCRKRNHRLPWRLKETLRARRLGPKKGLKRRIGCGGKGPENSSQSRPFLPSFHGYIASPGLKYVSVNYVFRFSGPVTALTARRVRYGVGPENISSAPG
jgi:hypothetical protein